MHICLLVFWTYPLNLSLSLLERWSVGFGFCCLIVLSSCGAFEISIYYTATATIIFPELSSVFWWFSRYFLKVWITPVSLLCPFVITFPPLLTLPPHQPLIASSPVILRFLERHKRNNSVCNLPSLFLLSINAFKIYPYSMCWWSLLFIAELYLYYDCATIWLSLPQLMDTV